MKLITVVVVGLMVAFAAVAYAAKKPVPAPKDDQVAKISQGSMLLMQACSNLQKWAYELKAKKAAAPLKAANAALKDNCVVTPKNTAKAFAAVSKATVTARNAYHKISN